MTDHSPEVWREEVGQRWFRAKFEQVGTHLHTPKAVRVNGKNKIEVSAKGNGVKFGRIPQTSLFKQKLSETFK